MTIARARRLTLTPFVRYDGGVLVTCSALSEFGLSFAFSQHNVEALVAEQG